ncbi:hypothetical protein NQZ68_034886 [Dissostichus eleginoides]|uniref:Methylthioribose-1-phosphate isomerase n=2 Tax=Nototheniidae TaxID=8206 RepID=A0AAD9BW04_DISEL|nr:hypothetical protein NQZ68_034886 [Dissostichus eleginoides]KAK1889418.1 Methylthioribose-1-phosphate isomerase [Dissostichus eleginoides]
MDWWTSLAAITALLWILCFIDGNAVLELRLLFHALTKAACHLYLALLPLRRAATHFADCARYMVNHIQRPTPSPLDVGLLHHGQPLGRKGTLHFLEGMCVVCETIPNLMGAGLSVGSAFCHMLQGGFYVLAATLHTIQVNLFSQMNGEKDRWDKERHRAKEGEKKLNSRVLEYISVFCQDPVSALRIKVDVPPVYR